MTSEMRARLRVSQSVPLNGASLFSGGGGKTGCILDFVSSLLNETSVPCWTQSTQLVSWQTDQTANEQTLSTERNDFGFLLEHSEVPHTGIKHA
jgi:hypothetical protein